MRRADGRKEMCLTPGGLIIAGNELPINCKCGELMCKEDERKHLM